jgi:DNA-binding NtrC family response regulator
MLSQTTQPSSGQNIQQQLPKTILVIEDDDSIGELLMDTLAQETTYQTLLATDAFQALQMIESVRPCLVITDYRLPRMNGLELYDCFHAKQGLANMPTIIMSAYLPVDEIKKRNLVSLSKPFELDDLLSTIEQVMHDAAS